MTNPLFEEPQRTAAIAKGVGLMNPVYAARAENSEVWVSSAGVISTLPLALRWSKHRPPPPARGGGDIGPA